MEKLPLASLPLEDLFKHLQSGKEGLSDQKAAALLAHFGPNSAVLCAALKNY